MVDKIPLSQITAASAAESRTSPEKIEHAAKQFESLLIGQLLKSMHESGSSAWMGSSEDQSSESAMELAEEQFAQCLASRGGLGLSRLIIQGLTKPQKASEAPSVAKLP